MVPHTFCHGTLVEFADDPVSNSSFRQMALVLGATALLGGASALYFRATKLPNHEEFVEARVFAPPSSWFEATTLVAEVRCSLLQPAKRSLLAS